MSCTAPCFSIFDSPRFIRPTPVPFARISFYTLLLKAHLHIQNPLLPSFLPSFLPPFLPSLPSTYLTLYQLVLPLPLPLHSRHDVNVAPLAPIAAPVATVSQSRKRRCRHTQPLSDLIATTRAATMPAAHHHAIIESGHVAHAVAHILVNIIDAQPFARASWWHPDHLVTRSKSVVHPNPNLVHSPATTCLAPSRATRPSSHCRPTRPAPADPARQVDTFHNVDVVDSHVCVVARPACAPRVGL